VPMSAQPEPEPEPEPQPEPEPEPEPEPDHGPQTQSREAALARAQPPGSVLSSSSDGSDDSSDRPEPGGAVFDVVQEVSRAACFCLDL
jgi:outer membrane biosynthesis protein TonB